MASLETFIKQVARVEVEHLAKIDDAVRLFAMKVLKSIVIETRVDTGRMRGNWTVTTGIPHEDFEQDAYSVKDDAGQGAIGRADEALMDMTLTDLITIFNNVPYVIYWPEPIDKAVARYSGL